MKTVWINGRLVPRHRASVSALDRGLLLGDGIFETVRVYGGRPFMLPEHLRRLRRSGRALGIGIAGDLAYWRQALERLCRVNGLAEAAVRLTVTRGAGPGLAPPARSRATALIHARPAERGLESGRARGVALGPLPLGRGPDFLSEHKTLGYLPAVIGRRLAHQRRAYDGLYTTGRGFVTEATTANVFAVIHQRLRTPATGMLPGIARALVIDLARRIGHRVEEKPMRRHLLDKAEEVFLTSSTVEVLPVIRIDGTPVSRGRPGPVTLALQDAYRNRVRHALRGKV